MAGAESPRLPPPHAARASAVELLLERQGRRVPVRLAASGVKPEGKGLRLVAAEAEHLRQLQFRPHILTVRKPEERMLLRDVVVGHQGIEQREHVARQVEVQPYELVRRLGHYGGVRGIIDRTANAEVDRIEERAPQVRILQERAIEVVADLIQFHETHAQGIYLVEEAAAHLSGIAVREVRHRPLVFGPVLVVVRDVELGTGDVAAAYLPCRIAQGMGQAEARGNSQLGRGSSGPWHHLPVAGKAYIQPFTAAQQVLMIEGQLR